MNANAGRNLDSPVFTINSCSSSAPHTSSEFFNDNVNTACELVRHAYASDSVRQSQNQQLEQRECGIFGCRPAFLQCFAKIKVFVFFCCILVTVQGSLASGYLNGVITTIEKRYQIPSSLSGLIASAYEIGSMMTVIFVSYLGSQRHIPVWLGVGVLVIGSGSILFALPHFIAERYTIQEHIIRNKSEQNMCRSSLMEQLLPGEPCIRGNASTTMYVVIFVIAQVFIGCGGSPIFTLGTTYIDDHVKKESSPLYIGCMYSMVAFGPVCGFLLGAFLLKYYVDTFSFDTASLNIDPTDPRWVGAWWGGFLICGLLLLLISVPFFAFPKSLSWEKEKLSQDKSWRSDIVSSQHADQNYGKNIKDIPKSMLKLLCNPIYVATCLGACMELSIVSAFIVFLPKYLETQFEVSKPEANVLTGGIAIPGACIGVFMGGYLLKRFQLRPKGAAQLILFFNLLCMGMFALLFFLGCDNIKMAGATMAYFNSSPPENFEVNLTATCNMGCECTLNNLEPICGINGVTYFSPCHAGCTQFHPAMLLDGKNNQNYSDCSCIVGNMTIPTFHEVTVTPLATSGFCPRICNMLIPFMVLLFIMSFVVSVTQMPVLMITLRSVAEEERAFALGMQFVIFRVFGYIPAPIMFGSVIDSTCLLWKAQCGKPGGACLLYDIEQFRYKYIGVSSGLKVIAGVMFLIVWLLIRRRYHEEFSRTLTVVDIKASLNSLDRTEVSPIEVSVVLPQQHTHLPSSQTQDSFISYESSI